MRALAIVVGTVAACGFAPNAREVPAPAADGFGPFRDRGPIEICEGPVRLVPPDPDGADGAGVCAPEGTEAARCSSSTACGPRERCVCGRCTVPRCRGSADCPTGLSCDLVTRVCTRTCFEDSDCEAGQDCEPEGCLARCGGDDDCSRGEVCLRSRGLCFAQRCEDGLACAGTRTCDRAERFAALGEPDVVRADGRMELYFEERGAAPAVRRAVSDDGVSFVMDPPGNVLDDAAAPAVLVVGAERVLFFERADGTIGRAVGDGATFEPDALAILEPTESWEGARVGAPAVAMAGEDVVIVYESDGGIGIARGPAEGPLDRVSGPIDAAFFEDPALFRFVGVPESPAIVVHESALGEPTFLLYAAAAGVETSDLVLGEEATPAPRTTSVVAAAATSDLVFAPYPFGPVFARVLNVTDYRSEEEPSLVFSGGSALLYYQGDASEGLSLAEQRTAGP